MKALLQVQNHTIEQQRSQIVLDGDYGVNHEEYFIERLAFEKKRSERSGKSFLLMTLTISGISGLQSARDTVRAAVNALSAFSRDTDIKGWYKHSSTLGIIFTETDDVDAETLRDTLYGRLRAHLTEAQINAMQMSFQRYPDVSQ